MLYFLIFFSGLVLGSVVFIFLFRKKQPFIETEKTQIQIERDRLLQENQDYKQREIKWVESVSSLKRDKEHSDKQLEDQKNHYKEKLQDKENYLKDKLQEREIYFKQQYEKINMAFENTANKIFKENTKSYREETTKNLFQILQPFKEDIEKFKDSVKGFESKGQHLENTITDFKAINKEMRDGSLRLTQVLRGDSQTQGQFGEFVLERILEKSGLRKGEEFIVQGQGLELKDEKGAFLKPDVIVRLPDDKHIVIDSKASFKHYHEYCSSHTENEKQQSLKKVLSSIDSHIKNLSPKSYHFSEKLKTPDFTLMFIPNEGIFSLVSQDLFEKAWEKEVVLVSPTTLFATLKTINSIWKIERQNKNAQEIAKQSGLLYDKFVGFLSDINDMGKGLKTAQNTYDKAYNKLTGRGNLISKAEKIKELGAKTKKILPQNLIS